MKNYLKFIRSSCLVLPVILLVLPASTNYKLDSYGFGAGGQDAMSSTNYSLEGILGETSGNPNSLNYGVNAGLIFHQMADVPPAPTFVNSSNWYNKLHITINQSDNPSDATYAIAISDDNWATTEWVQNDNTVGSALGPEDFQTYAAWGSGTGEDIINLTPNTTYKVRVKARHGDFTESGLGPEASAATSAITLDFDIDVNASDTETATPYAVNFGELTIASVNTASDKIWIDLTTNAENGGFVYIYGANAGLSSANTGYTISSSSTDLSSTGEGFGIREDSASSLAFLSPYNVAADNVGVVDTTIREIVNSSFAPVSSGRASILVKAKPSSTTPAANDYTDTLTLISSATF